MSCISEAMATLWPIAWHEENWYPWFEGVLLSRQKSQKSWTSRYHYCSSVPTIQSLSKGSS